MNITQEKLTKDDTIIKNVMYSLDKHGVVTPTILIDPPVTIKTTLSNGSIIEQHKSTFDVDFRSFINLDNTMIGSTITINKETILPENETVPSSELKVMLVNNDHIDKSNIIPIKINECPSCSRPLKNYTGILICTNSQCSTKLFSQCLYFLNHMKIRLHGVYFKIFSTLCARGVIQDQSDIFKIHDVHAFTSIEDITPKHREIYYKLIYSSLHPTINFVDFIIALDIIPNIHDSDSAIKFSRYLSTKIDTTNRFTCVYAFMNFVRDTVKKYSEVFQVIYEHIHNSVSVLDIFDLLSKLNTHDQNELINDFGGIPIYDIAAIINYVFDQTNSNMLHKFAEYFSATDQSILEQITCNK